MERGQRWISRFEVKPGRWVYVPAASEMEYGRALIAHLDSRWTLPRFYYHLRDGGHVAALRSHLGHQFFCCFDIENFFGSVSKNRITRSLKQRLGYSAAREIAERSTVKVLVDGRQTYCLPFGFSQSPLLASICLSDSRLGAELYRLFRLPLFLVSVYVDDIIISSNSLSALKRAFNDVVDSAKVSGFSLCLEKLQEPAAVVTSFNVELSHRSLKIVDSRMKKFAEDYMVSSNDCQRTGIVGYIKSVNPRQVDDLFTLIELDSAVSSGFS